MNLASDVAMSRHALPFHFLLFAGVVACGADNETTAAAGSSESGGEVDGDGKRLDTCVTKRCAAKWT